MDDPGKPRVTIRSLAKQLGCSHAAVSLALRNSPKVEVDPENWTGGLVG